MSVAFDKALAFTCSRDVEGGHANVAGDRGGLTFNGVTQKAYDSWRARHGMASRSVDLITEDEERALYFEDYWTPCRCEDLPAGLGAAVFDMAVNSGVMNATITLQEALSVRQDGQIGVVTLTAAANATDPVLRFLRKRNALFRDLVAERPQQVIFLEGWVNRLLNFQDAFHKGAFA